MPGHDLPSVVVTPSCGSPVSTAIIPPPKLVPTPTLFLLPVPSQNSFPPYRTRKKKKIYVLRSHPPHPFPSSSSSLQCFSISTTFLLERILFPFLSVFSVPFYSSFFYSSRPTLLSLVHYHLLFSVDFRVRPIIRLILGVLIDLFLFPLSAFLSFHHRHPWPPRSSVKAAFYGRALSISNASCRTSNADSP